MKSLREDPALIQEREQVEEQAARYFRERLRQVALN